MYAYVENEPIGAIDFMGLNREIIIWSPMLRDPGSWLGHLSSISQNGVSNSFGPGGWDTRYPTGEAYINRQTEDNGRVGLGLEIAMTPDQDKRFDDCISEIKRKDEKYDRLLNNCTAGAQACLWSAGVNFEFAITPAGVMQNLLDANTVERVIFHAGKSQ